MKQMMMRTAVLAMAVAPVAFAQAGPPETEVGIAMLAMTTAPAKGGAKLTVTSPAFKTMTDIPQANTQWGTNTFPGLEWTAAPAGTKSYVVIMQDTDAMRQGSPILHWTMVEIPASMTKLAAGMTDAPSGAMHGPNMRGMMQAYLGPRTPAGPKHRYHLQVFALDNSVSGESMAGANGTEAFTAMLNAMKGHVLASGEVVGLGSAPPK